MSSRTSYSSPRRLLSPARLAVASALVVFSTSSNAQMAPYFNQLVNTVQEQLIKKVLAKMGIGLEGAVTESGAALQGELLKATAAKKASMEALAAYRTQTQMHRDAVALADSLKSPAITCDTIAAQDGIAKAKHTVQARTLQSQRSVVERLAKPESIATKIEAQHQLTNARFCTAAEAARGICTATASPLAGADQNAAFLFQGADGSPTFVDGQDAAAKSYISRVVALAPAEQMRGNDYAKNPRARAFVELKRRYDSVLSMASYSLSQIASRQAAIGDLGATTNTANISVGGFSQGKRDLSMTEAVQRFIAKRFSPDSIQDSLKATNENQILRDIAQTQAFQLWLDQQTLQQDARTESLMAQQLALLTEQTLRPALDQQRRMAAQSIANRR